ncbi:twin-arginine translocation signal domain-containing protein [Yeosuana marina]|uniref:twin-arginine translocation signal domain-containing protein n=1 Tax=Yeosuana marina TaxID=1565536 RepID=UPI0030EE5C58|tara:strand:+ start:498 stop:857 length:360 start_codon:yes stop_codon:yes gene_type:complete
MKAKNITEKVKPNRRDFLVNLSVAAAALTLNSAFGFPVETEQGNGKLFLKISSVEGNSESKNGIFQFSETDLEKLKRGKMESLAAKVEISFDQRRWKTIETSITDRNFMKQLIEIARKA